MKRFTSLFLSLTLLMFACGDDDATTTTTSPPATATTTTLPPPVAERVTSYLAIAKGGFSPLVAVDRSVAVEPSERIAAAVDMMLKGETFTEAGMGLYTAVPRDTTLLGVTVGEGFAVLDLSSEFLAIDERPCSMKTRLAQVVFTATQFDDGIDDVKLMVEGLALPTVQTDAGDYVEPFERADFQMSFGPVFVERPAWGETIGSEFTVSGVAFTEKPPFDPEGIISWAVTDWDGLIMAEGTHPVPPPSVTYEPFVFDVDLTEIDIPAHPAGSFDLTLIVWRGEVPSVETWPGLTNEHPLFYVPPVVTVHGSPEGAIELQVGQHLQVYLEGNPSAGYAWDVSSQLAPILDQMGEPQFRPDSDLIGAPGEFLFEFEAVRAGETHVIFDYLRPWEDVPPLEVADLTVIVR